MIEKVCIKKLQNPNKLIFLSIFIIFIYSLPYFILAGDSDIRIHDNLDSNIPLIKILSESQKIFSSNQVNIDNIMNGLPRASFGSEFNLYFWLSSLLGPLFAYIFNQFFIRIIAFIGFHLLLSKHLIKNKNDYILYGIPLAFSLIPFWSLALLSIAGQPLLFYSFCNFLKNENDKYDYFIIAFFVMYSSLVLVGPFIIFSLIMIAFIDLIRNNKYNYNFYFSIVFLIILYILVNYRLFNSNFINSDFISHRVEWDRSFLSYNIFYSLRYGLSNFIFGHMHARSLHEPIIILSVPVLLYLAYSKIIIKEKVIFLLFGLLFFSSILFGLYSWEGLLLLKDKIPILKTYQWDRFHMLQPFIWYLLLAFILTFLDSMIKNKKLIFFIILIQLSYVFTSKHSEQFKNWKIVINNIMNKKSSYISYDDFFSIDLFKQIDDFIGIAKNRYKVVSVGLHPSISQYNGFHTLDAYVPNYPLNYKRQFRKIIKNELEKSETFKRYFDAWGSRCYLFVSELENLGFVIDKRSKAVINNLDIDTSELKKMNCKYIFSAVEIKNYNQLNLILLKIFDEKKSPWKIHLYEII